MHRIDFSIDDAWVDTAGTGPAVGSRVLVTATGLPRAVPAVVAVYAWTGGTLNVGLEVSQEDAEMMEDDWAEDGRMPNGVIGLMTIPDPPPLPTCVPPPEPPERKRRWWRR